MSATIRLYTSDGDSVPVALKDIRCSGTIMKTIEEAEGEEKEHVYLTNVNSAVLEKVLEWTKHHKGDPTPEETAEWDAAYLEKQIPGDLFDIILAATYLDIKELRYLASKKVAQMIKERPVEEIREVFHITNDLEEQEVQQIRTENEWCLEK